MNRHLPLQARLAQFLLRETPTNPSSPLRLSQIHSLLITTTALQFHTSSTVFSLSNPSTVPQSTNLFPRLQEPDKWNLAIRHASATSPLNALSLFREMRREIPCHGGDPFICASVIKACNKARALLEGKSMHCHIIRVGLDRNANVSNSLVSFYASSANLMRYARKVFDGVSPKSVVTVNCMMSGNIDRRNPDAGMSLFVGMMGGCFGFDVRPNYVTFVILISGCVENRGLRTGNALHCLCRKMGLDSNLEICNALIGLYAKSGSILDAGNVLTEMPIKDVISWNSMIHGYVSTSDFARAFSLFREMRIENVGVDRVTFSCLLSACAAAKDLCLGRTIHARVKANGLEFDVSVRTALVNMYSRCRKVESARKLFDEIPKINIEYWNAMIHAYIDNNLAREAFKLFDQIELMGLEMDEVTILGLIMACRDTGDFHRGNLVNSIVESKECFKRSLVLGNALIDMYAKFGSMMKAKAVFDRMPQKDVVSWTSVIVGHAVNGEADKSLATFKQMCDEKFVPNYITFIGVLSACDHGGLVEQGRKMYEDMFEVYNMKPGVEHCGCVVDMLARAGKLEDARIFVRQMPMEPNALVWRMLMNGCKVHGEINLGLKIIPGVKQLNGPRESAEAVILSNIYAEAGKWSDVVSGRNCMVIENAPKVAGKSSVIYLTE